MKMKSLIIGSLAVCTITGTALATYKITDANARTTVQMSSNPEDDVKIGKITLEKIHKEAGITSNRYDISYPFGKGTLDKDAGLWDKAKHVVAGKSMEYQAYASYELKSNLTGVTKNDITYDKETKTLSLTLEKPELHLELDKNNTDPDSFVGLFASDFTEKERFRIQQQAEDVGKMTVKKDKEKMEQAEQDIRDILTGFLTVIDGVEEVHIDFK